MIARQPSRQDFRIKVPVLNPGDHLSGAEFLHRYEARHGPERFELIEGVVYMMAPMRHPHGRFERLLSAVFLEYEDATPGVETASGITVVLGEKNVPEPDGVMYLLPEYGGQARISEEQYFIGAPEMVLEIAHSTVAIDLVEKRQAYEEAGVLEYMVVCIEDEEVILMDLPLEKRIEPNVRGVLKSLAFPGFWLDTRALFAKSIRGLIATIRQGLRSPEHVAFVQKMRSTQVAKSPPKKRKPPRAPRKKQDEV